NGCGKSNVADAIAWVLGEQRIKHLRGAEMKDVIFQGSRNRKPSGMAEVVLHLERDQFIEHEPDIEDIDSTLEKIDETVADFDELGATQSLESNESVSAIPESIELAADESDPNSLTNDSATARTQPHHRHWRRRNLALEFA